MARTKLIMDAVLRSRRRLTLPREVCERLGIGPDDVLELTVEDSALIIRPGKAVALDALREIREAFTRAGVTEEELQEEGRRVRQQLATQQRRR